MAETIASTDALQNATRLLQAAEAETNLTLMDALIRAAEVWTLVATQLAEQE